MTNVAPKTRGRKPKLSNDVVANVLNAVHVGDTTPVSRFLMKQLVAKGLVGTEKIPQDVKKRGRQPSKWILTGQGRSRRAMFERNAAAKAAKLAAQDAPQGQEQAEDVQQAA